MIAARAAVPLPLPAPLSAASDDAALQAALLATPGLDERTLTAAQAAYHEARREHGEHYAALDAEWERVKLVLRQARAALNATSCNPNSSAWWAVKVAELRAYLAAEEGFRATSARLDRRTPSDRLAALPVSTQVQAARLAGLLHPHEPMLTEAVQ